MVTAGSFRAGGLFIFVKEMINIAIKLLTSVTYTATGEQTTFAIPFDYLRPAFVYVSVDEQNITEGFEVVDRTVKFSAPPAKGAVVRIYRSTTTKRLVSWADASILKAKDMTAAEVQQLHLIEEEKDWSRENTVHIDKEGVSSNQKFNPSFRVKPDAFIKTNSKGTGLELYDKADMDADIYREAGKYINAHPEYVTTVMDGAVSESKLAPTLAKKKASWYKSVAEMKADSLLFAGMTACTFGYYSPNDGGAGTYIIRAKADGDVDDGGSLHELAHGNVAELVVENGTVNTIQLGLSKTDEHGNNLKKLGNAINKGFKVIVTDIYNINSGETQYLQNDLFVKGKSKECGFVFNGAPEYLFQYCHEVKSIDISFLTFKNQKESRVTLFYENSNEKNMVDMDLFSCCDCVFLGDTTLQRQNYINRIYNDSEQLPRINSVIINDNIIRDCPSSFCQCADVCFEKFEIQRNSVRNFKYLLFNVANTNLPDDASDAWKDKYDRLFLGMKNLIVKNNHTVNDDDCITQNLTSGTTGYHAFVVAETQMVEFSGNYTEGLKAETLAVYDAYLSCKDVVYTDNVWKNNMQYKSNLNCTLIKCKEGGGLRTYSNNNFVLDNEFINMLVNKYGAKKEDCYVELCSLVSPVEIQINNNFFDIAQLIFFQSNMNARLYTFSNNVMELNNARASYLTTCIKGSKTVFTNNIINIKNVSNGNLSLVNPSGIQDITFCNNKITVTNGAFYQDNINITANSSFKNNELRLEDGVFFDNMLFYEDSSIKTKVLKFSKKICKNFDYQNSYKLIGETLMHDYCTMFLNHELSYVLFFDVIIYNRETAKKTITSFSLKHYFENEQEKLILNMPDGTTKEYDFSVSSWVNILSDIIIITCPVVDTSSFSLMFNSNSVDYFDFELNIKYVYLK